MTPILYASPTCMPCKMIQKWFSDNGFALEVRDAVLNPEYGAELKAMGYTSAPVLLMNGEEHLGFLPDLYEKWAKEGILKCTEA